MYYLKLGIVGILYMSRGFVSEKVCNDRSSAEGADRTGGFDLALLIVGCSGSQFLVLNLKRPQFPRYAELV